MGEEERLYMKDQKGILGRLLLFVGGILVVAGVFAFQGFSHADDIVSTPVDVGGLGLTTGEGLTDGDGGSVDGGFVEGGSEPAGESDPDATDELKPANEFSIKYYKIVDEEKVLLFEDTVKTDDEEKVFKISETIPEDEAEFLAWYDEKEGKYYKALDEVTLNAESSLLELVAKFAVLKQFALEYDVDGGINTPNSQVCESYYDTCEFKVSSVIPTREGYEFKGWRIPGTDMIYLPDAILKSINFEKPLIVKAVWAEVKTYTLLYEGNGGMGVPEPQICKSADGFCKFTVSDKTPTKPESGFLDWQKGDITVGPGSEIVATESVTILVANWNPILIFTLEYVAEEAKDIPEPQKCETAMGTCTFIVPDKEPTKDGFRFKGWRFEDKEDMLAKAGDELMVGVDGPLSLKVIAVWSKIYPVLNSGEVFGAGERIVLRTMASASDFKEITIDSELVPEDYFAISEDGATSIILSNAFSQALSAGEHAFAIEWKDGEAHGIISVNQSEDGTKRFVIVDMKGSTDASTLMLRPKAGAVSKESVGGGAVDSAKDNGESNFDAVKTLIIIAAAAFVVVYIINRFYLRHKMEFIENFK